MACRSLVHAARRAPVQHGVALHRLAGREVLARAFRFQERLDREDRLTFQLTGRLDAHQVPRIRAELEPLDRDFTLDLAGTGFIDSTGLAMLVTLTKRARERGVEFEVINLQDSVKLIVELMRLDQVLPIVN